MKHLRQRISLILALVFVFSLLYIPALAGTLNIAATPVQYTFFIDERNISVWGYEIRDNVYFKLRDLAATLSGTERQFDVSWDESRNTVLLTTGTDYTPSGSELSKPSDAVSALANSPATDFYIENKQIPIRAYIVNNAHYIILSDLAANLFFASSCDGESHTVVIDTSMYDTGIYSFSLPEGWSAEGSSYYLNLTRSGESVGSFIIRNYDHEKPISQLEDNHRTTLSGEDLNGFDYHAAKAMIRMTQPAVANDDSYVDELHIYIMPEDLHCAFDFCFDSSKEIGRAHV